MPLKSLISDSKGRLLLVETGENRTPLRSHSGLYVVYCSRSFSFVLNPGNKQQDLTSVHLSPPPVGVNVGVKLKMGAGQVRFRPVVTACMCPGLYGTRPPG